VGVGVIAQVSSTEEFDGFVADAERRLRRALVGAVGERRVDDAVGEALLYLAEHRDQVMKMENPVGYLFRVGQTRTRPRRRPQLPPLESTSVAEFEPKLIPALMGLPDQQRIAVWLAHACGWTHREIAIALDVSPSTVATHVRRAIDRLRTELGDQHD
jgi:RNA polymerase sigma factor (sigma-70 family)